MPINSVPIHELLGVELNELSDAELEAYYERLKSLRKRDLSQVLEDEATGRTEYKGFLYVLSNPAMPGLVKIGSTEGPVAARARELSKPTAIPEPFRVEGSFPVYTSPKGVERLVHEALAPYRANRNREFFRVSVEYAVVAIGGIIARNKAAKV